MIFGFHIPGLEPVWHPSFVVLSTFCMWTLVAVRGAGFIDAQLFTLQGIHKVVEAPEAFDHPGCGKVEKCGPKRDQSHEYRLIPVPQ